MMFAEVNAANYGLSEAMEFALCRTAIESLRYLNYAPESEWGWGIKQAHVSLRTVHALEARGLAEAPERDLDREEIGYHQAQYANERRLGWHLTTEGEKVAEALYEKYEGKSYKKAAAEIRFAEAAKDRRREQKRQAIERRAHAVALKLSGTKIVGGVATSDPNYEGVDAGEYIEGTLGDGSKSIHLTLGDLEKIIERVERPLKAEIHRYQSSRDA